MQQESSSRDKRIFICCIENFQFSRKMNIIRPKTPSFRPGQPYLAPPMLVCWWQTMARWNYDTKISSLLAIYQGSGTITKNDYVLKATRQYQHHCCVSLDATQCHAVSWASPCYQKNKGNRSKYMGGIPRFCGRPWYKAPRLFLSASVVIRTHDIRPCPPSLSSARNTPVPWSRTNH